VKVGIWDGTSEKIWESALDGVLSEQRIDEVRGA
jgi:hypothetical protein